jgi:tRNA-dihydrouridine synthase A
MREATSVVKQMSDRGWCDYTALNLNCGCPSPKVAGKGCFGAALMDEPTLVRDLCQSMDEGMGGTTPITVKCRIGTDTGYTFTRSNYETLDPEQEYAKLCGFIETVAEGGVVTDFQVHARIAVLQKSFSPADNRSVPPLRYDFIRRLTQDYPQLTFSLNGGIETLSQAKSELEHCPTLQGVMIGRAWAANPWSFSMTDSMLYNESSNDDVNTPKNRLELLQTFGKHADREEEEWDAIKIRRFLVKCVSGLFAGEPNGKRYRIALDEVARLPKKMAKEGKSLEGMLPISEQLIMCATQHLSDEVLLRTPQESWERIQYEEERAQIRLITNMGTTPSTKDNNSTTSTAHKFVQEWQVMRKENEEQERLRDEDETDPAERILHDCYYNGTVGSDISSPIQSRQDSDGLEATSAAN